MSRFARIVAPGLPHHITQRGSYEQDVFFCHGDREKYLEWIEKYSNKYQLEIISYCLMTNHIHFIAIPEKLNSMARTINIAHMLYAQNFNKKMGKCGHLWHSRYFSCVMDEQHLIAAARYIERNPVRARLVENPWEWEWSSAAFHCGIQTDPKIKLGDFFNLIDMNHLEWREFISREDETLFISKIKKSTYKGTPLAGETFIKNLEKKLGRKLKPNPPGRRWK